MATAETEFPELIQTGSDALAPWRELKNDFEKSSRKIKDRSTRLKEKADAIASAASASRAAIQLRRLDAYSTQDRDDVSMFTPSEAMSKIDLHDVFPCHNIPFAPNEGFYGRSKELDAVVTSCSQSDEKMVSFVLWGMGGIGKTQIAAQYAHQSYVSGTQAVLWVNCETGLSISKSFKEIVQLLHLSGPVVDDNSDQNRLRVLQWLSKAGMLEDLCHHEVGANVPSKTRDGFLFWTTLRTASWQRIVGLWLIVEPYW